METLTLILLIIGAIWICIGIYRVATTPTTTFLDFFVDLLLLDLLIDLLGAVFSAIMEFFD